MLRDERVVYGDQTVLDVRIESGGDITIYAFYSDEESHDVPVERYLAFEELEALYFAAMEKRLRSPLCPPNYK